jgi:hypothetical protein
MWRDKILYKERFLQLTSYNKGYEIPSKQVALHPNGYATSHNQDIKSNQKLSPMEVRR